MNKYDIFLIIIIILLGITLSLLKKDNNGSMAYVYYDGNKVLDIDLTDYNYRTYEVEGLLGIITIETVDGKVKVVEENSPKHLCSIQGYISSSNESIICLPNKVVIEIEDSESLDTIVR